MDDSFSEYVSARGEALLRFAFLLCRDRHLAEDLVQDVLVKMHRRWSAVQAAELPDAYVRKSLVHEFLSWRRRLSSREVASADLTDLTPAVPDGTATTANRDEMWRLLGGLSRAQRAVLVLRFYEDLEYNDIAAIMGCSATTARVHANRGLSRLRFEMEPVTQSATATAGGRE